MEFNVKSADEFELVNGLDDVDDVDMDVEEGLSQSSRELNMLATIDDFLIHRKQSRIISEMTQQLLASAPTTPSSIKTNSNVHENTASKVVENAINAVVESESSRRRHLQREAIQEGARSAAVDWHRSFLDSDEFRNLTSHVQKEFGEQQSSQSTLVIEDNNSSSPQLATDDIRRSTSSRRNEPATEIETLQEDIIDSQEEMDRIMLADVQDTVLRPSRESPLTTYDTNTAESDNGDSTTPTSTSSTSTSSHSFLQFLQFVPLVHRRSFLHLCTLLLRTGLLSIVNNAMPLLAREMESNFSTLCKIQSELESVHVADSDLSDDCIQSLDASLLRIAKCGRDQAYSEQQKTRLTDVLPRVETRLKKRLSKIVNLCKHSFETAENKISRWNKFFSVLIDFHQRQGPGSRNSPLPSSTAKLLQTRFSLSDAIDFWRDSDATMRAQVQPLVDDISKASRPLTLRPPAGHAVAAAKQHPHQETQHAPKELHEGAQQESSAQSRISPAILDLISSKVRYEEALALRENADQMLEGHLRQQMQHVQNMMKSLDFALGEVESVNRPSEHWPTTSDRQQQTTMSRHRFLEEDGQGNDRAYYNDERKTTAAGSIMHSSSPVRRRPHSASSLSHKSSSARNVSTALDNNRALSSNELPSRMPLSMRNLVEENRRAMCQWNNAEVRKEDLHRSQTNALLYGLELEQRTTLGTNASVATRFSVKDPVPLQTRPQSANSLNQTRKSAMPRPNDSHSSHLSPAELKTAMQSLNYIEADHLGPRSLRILSNLQFEGKPTKKFALTDDMIELYQFSPKRLQEVFRMNPISPDRKQRIFDQIRSPAEARTGNGKEDLHNPYQRHNFPITNGNRPMGPTKKSHRRAVSETFQSTVSSTNLDDYILGVVQSKSKPQLAGHKTRTESPETHSHSHRRIDSVDSMGPCSPESTAAAAATTENTELHINRNTPAGSPKLRSENALHCFSAEASKAAQEADQAHRKAAVDRSPTGPKRFGFPFPSTSAGVTDQESFQLFAPNQTLTSSVEHNKHEELDNPSPLDAARVDFEPSDVGIDIGDFESFRWRVRALYDAAGIVESDEDLLDTDLLDEQLDRAAHTFNTLVDDEHMNAVDRQQLESETKSLSSQVLSLMKALKSTVEVELVQQFKSCMQTSKLLRKECEVEILLQCIEQGLQTSRLQNIGFLTISVDDATTQLPVSQEQLHITKSSSKKKRLKSSQTHSMNELFLQQPNVVPTALQRTALNTHGAASRVYQRPFRAGTRQTVINKTTRESALAARPRNSLELKLQTQLRAVQTLRKQLRTALMNLFEILTVDCLQSFVCLVSSEFRFVRCRESQQQLEDAIKYGGELTSKSTSPPFNGHPLEQFMDGNLVKSGAFDNQALEYLVESNAVKLLSSAARALDKMSSDMLIEAKSTTRVLC